MWEFPHLALQYAKLFLHGGATISQDVLMLGLIIQI